MVMLFSLPSLIFFLCSPSWPRGSDRQEEESPRMITWDGRPSEGKKKQNRIYNMEGVRATELDPPSPVLCYRHWFGLAHYTDGWEELLVDVNASGSFISRFFFSYFLFLGRLAGREKAILVYE
ncbi:hypothetical protein VTJ04DRAFT_9464 [Mycothermus thermophilus]|uniref:uncharacterized protein n=1 Tax=Humicola insolens TaxID=85995 RepID=UPI0037445BAA